MSEEKQLILECCEYCDCSFEHFIDLKEIYSLKAQLAAKDAEIEELKKTVENMLIGMLNTARLAGGGGSRCPLLK